MIPREIFKKLRKIEIRTSRLVSETFAGSYQSVFKGRGMEFSEVREYQQGDEVRTIDWNVTSRMGHPFVKQYVEERELTVVLVLDASGSGEFGSASQLKREVATDYAGSAEIESYTVMFGAAQAAPTKSYTSIYGKAADTGSEPSVAHLVCRLPDGRRTWANLEDPETLEAMCHEEFCGRSVRIDGQGSAAMA